MASNDQSRKSAANEGNIEGTTRSARRVGVTTALVCIALTAFIVLSAVPQVASASGNPGLYPLL